MLVFTLLAVQVHHGLLVLAKQVVQQLQLVLTTQLTLHNQLVQLVAQQASQVKHTTLTMLQQLVQLTEQLQLAAIH